MSEKSAMKQSWITGLALFSVFFGAGNLIFPPYLGVESGPNWLAFILFLITDVGIAILGILASSKRPEVKMSALMRSGKVLYYALSFPIAMLMIVVPRTCATAFELAVRPLFPSLPPVVFSIIFFGLFFLLAIRPSKVLDNLGKYLTPALLIGLFVVIVVGLFNPLGEVADKPQIENLFAEGVIQGYQTFDGIGGPYCTMFIVASIAAAGFTEAKKQQKIIFKGGLIAGGLLALVYGGLFILGQHMSTEFGPDIQQTELLVTIIRRLLGTPGIVLFGIIVTLACLTTAIGVGSGGCQMMTKCTGEKVDYKWFVVLFSVVGIIFSVIGVSNLLKYAAPFLVIIFPPFITLFVLSMFTDKIKSDNAFIFGAVTAIVCSVCRLLGVPFISTLPGSNIMFGWVIPTAIMSIVGIFVPSKKHRDPRYEELWGNK